MSSEEVGPFCPLIREDCKKKECMLYVIKWGQCSINYIGQEIEDISDAISSLEESLGNLLTQV